MSILHKHNSVLQNKLQAYITAQDVNGLATCLQSLSVGEFRTAGYMLGEKVLVTATKDYFWKVFIQFTRQNAKAFLGTCLKAFVWGYKDKKFSLSIASLQTFATYCTQIDCKKTLEAILPILRTSDEVQQLTSVFIQYEGKSLFADLIKAHTLPCYYELFRLLKAEDEAQIRQVIMLLVKRNDPITYSVANALKRYFDINGIPVSFSSHIEDYQLSCLDQGYDGFKKIITK